jgi:Fe-S cluster assembly protein SufD
MPQSSSQPSSQPGTTTQTPAVQAGIFTREAVAALAERLNEPAWMQEKRQVAWSVFEETPMPTTHDEDWRRTDFSALQWDQLRLSAASSLKPVARLADLPGYLRTALDAGQTAAGRLALVNGQAVYHELDEAAASQGVVFTDLTTAVRDYPDLVRPYFMTECVAPSDGKFTALNGAFWQGGVFLYVPKDVQIAQPFQVVIGLEGEGTAIFPHTLIVAEQLASVTYIEETVSPNGGGQALSDGIVEIIAGDAAQIHYTEVQGWGDNVFNFNTKRAVHRPDSRVVWEMGQLGGHMTKTYVDNILTGNGSSTEFNGVYFVGGQQHVDVDTLTHHIGVATSADLMLNGAARDRARAVFQGMVKIERSGQQTNAYLKNDNLLLSNRARADSIPGLQIDANDVRASHGATVGRIDEEYIFYLQSRGIPRSIAVRMIVEGFFSSVFDRMSQERVREKLAAAVSAKIGD